MRVFCADDSLTLLGTLTSVLGEIPGVTVVGTARDAGAAIAAIEELKPDVVTLDLRIPGGGIKVLKHIKGMLAAPVAIVLTSYAYPQYREECRRLGADFFFEKGTESHCLVQTLRTMTTAPGPQ